MGSFQMPPLLRAAAGVAGALVLAAGVAACGSDNGKSDSAGSGPTATASTAAASLDCGKTPGKKATGTPLTFGALVTKQPGIDFTPESAAAQAYFDCVNDNGGINGHPIKYVVKTEQSNPQQASSLATQLLQSDKVDGMVGNMSLVDCSVNGKTYAAAGIRVIGSGVDNACFQIPNFASVTSGPLYAPQLSAQYLIKNGAKGGMVGIQTRCPGCDVYNTGVLAVAKKAGFTKLTNMTETVPINDPGAVALRMANAAGDGGGATVGFTPGEDIKVLQAISQQGLIDKVHWGCVGICDDAGLVKALGPEWNGKLSVPTDYPLLDADTPTMNLFRGVMSKYASDQTPTNYGQMGFLGAKILVDTLQQLPEAQLNRKGINKAIVGIKNYKTDMLCNPWYYGDTKVHVPVDAGRIIQPKDGKFVEASGCTDLEPVTPQLEQARADVSKLGLRG